MREIKFRAWNIQHKAMLDNVGIAPNRETIDWTISAGSDGTYVSPRNSVDLYHIMQFTGLRDKNGKEIYEGDIVHCSIEGDNIGNVDVIQFKDASFCLRYRDRSIPSWIEFGNELEVIGNIHQNHELLNQGV